MATKDHFTIHGPEDYKLYYHMSPEGHIWLDAKNNPIPLNSQLVGHIESIDPILIGSLELHRQAYTHQ